MPNLRSGKEAGVCALAVLLLGTLLDATPLAAQRPQGGGSLFPSPTPAPPQLPLPTSSNQTSNRSLFEQDRGQRIVDVRIVGNQTVSEDTIVAQLRTRQDRQFDPEIVRADKHRLTSTKLFQDVRIYTQSVPEGVVVTFEVFERPTINVVEFHGNRGISDKVLLKESGLVVGEALNLYAVDEGRRKIEDFYRRKGYPKARVWTVEGDQPSDRAAVFQISEGPMQRILRTEFIGNTIASDSRLKTQIDSKPDFIPILPLFKGKVDRDKIDEDVQRLTAYYRGLGYFRARVGRQLVFNRTQEWLTLRFVIDEGPRYVVRNVTVVGNQRFSAEQLRSQLELKQGEFFNLAKMSRDENTLRDLYGSQGHVFSDIQADLRFLDEGSELDLVFNVNEGRQFRVGRINVHVAGEFPHTRETVVLDRLSIRPGDIVDVREVRNSERRLKASQLFENDPTNGKAPRIVIRPPELSDADVIAGGTAGTVRGQSPDRRSVRKINLDVFVTPAPNWRR